MYVRTCMRAEERRREERKDKEKDEKERKGDLLFNVEGKTLLYNLKGLEGLEGLEC